jgi:eukaryotic-like serine/threonine-protein kinase
MALSRALRLAGDMPGGERWSELDGLLDQALELPEAQRAEFLSRACAGDLDLQQDLSDLLRACERAGQFLEVPAVQSAAALFEDRLPDASVEAETASAPDLLLDRLRQSLAPAYAIERELTGAGMSRLFLARETALDRRVVLKLLPPDLAAGVNVERFVREIRLTARLQDPHIVPLLAAGSAVNLLYYTMPFVDGESLRVRLAREGMLPLRTAARLLHDIAGALAYAHGQGVVHRDLKPENVLLTRDRALVADFGIGKAVSSARQEEGGKLTAEGLAIGTPAYMAPEQAMADPDMDHRADLYAFGLIAYEMLAGAPVFTADSPKAMLTAHLLQPPQPITGRRTGIPGPLANVVMRCLEKRPADRPQSAEEIIRELDEVIFGGL